MARFCVLKSTIPEQEGVAIINEDDIKILSIVKHPRTKQDVYLLESAKNQFYFTEFVTKESSLQEAIEYFHHEFYRGK